MAVQGTGQLHIIGGDSSWLFFEEDSDDDDDSLEDVSDDCSTGDLGWTSGSTTDHDSDGCADGIGATVLETQDFGISGATTPRGMSLSDGGFALSSYFTTNFTLGQHQVNVAPGNDSGFIAKMSAAGSWDWVFSFSVDGNIVDAEYDLAPAEDGGVYFTISYTGTVTINGTEYSTEACCGANGIDRSDLLLIKLDGAGNVDWSAEFGSRANENAFALLVDSNYNVTVHYYLTGLPGCQGYNWASCLTYLAQHVDTSQGENGGLSHQCGGQNSGAYTCSYRIEFSASGSLGSFERDWNLVDGSWSTNSMILHDGSTYSMSNPLTNTDFGDSNGFEIIKIWKKLSENLEC